MKQYAALDDTVYFWFAANDTSGSGGDGASPAADVRLAGGAADAAPVYSPTPVLLTHANYPAGAYEISIAATAANGFAINNTYTTIGFDMWMFSRRTLIFDMFTYVWPSSRLAPWDWMGIGMNNIYNSEELALPLGGYNFAILQNSTIDQLMADIPWAGGAAQPMYNNLSAHGISAIN